MDKSNVLSSQFQLHNATPKSKRDAYLQLGLNIVLIQNLLLVFIMLLVLSWNYIDNLLEISIIISFITKIILGITLLLPFLSIFGIILPLLLLSIDIIGFIFVGLGLRDTDRFVQTPWKYFIFLAASLGIWRVFIFGGSLVVQGIFISQPFLLIPPQLAFSIGFTAFLLSGFLIYISIKKLAKYLNFNSKIIHYYV